MNAEMTAASGAERRVDLDWVRIIAFGLLIFYHVACFYSSITPHDQALSPRTIPWLIVPMLALNPWRLLILFIVSGAATRFMADKLTPGALLKSRGMRLLPPLVLAVFVIVPPEGYVAVIERLDYRGDYFSFLVRYFTVHRSLCLGPHCSGLPSYGHLWFVAYLFDYTLLLIALLAMAPGALRGAQQRLEHALRGWGLIAWPAAYLIAARIGLEHRFPQSYDFVHDWYANATYLGGFLFGYLTARSDAVWNAFERVRRPALIGAVSAYALLIASAIIALGADFNWAPKVAASQGSGSSVTPLLIYAGVLYGLDQWLWIAAAFGFARRHLSRRDGPARRYLTDAIFPFYITHEVTITVGGHYLTRLGLPLGIEAATLLGATALSCVITYEAVRRVGWLRPLFGLKLVAARPSAVTPPRRDDLSAPMYER
jgi:glucan biosynthesis protein C